LTVDHAAELSILGVRKVRSFQKKKTEKTSIKVVRLSKKTEKTTLRFSGVPKMEKTGDIDKTWDGSSASLRNQENGDIEQ
jgi:hypothetical protein